MTYSKKFPRQVKGSAYPKWEEITLTDSEERNIEGQSRAENIRLMEESIDDAKGIIDSKNLKRFQTNLVDVAIALFEKRASHVVYWKEEKAKKKFDEKFSSS